MCHFVRRKQWKLPLQILRFSRACAITLFMEVIQSFISCPRISLDRCSRKPLAGQQNGMHNEADANGAVPFVFDCLI